ncbi:MAG: glucose-1-phosphate cytidylyltransferase [Candidatus Riflebacteria bacterium]|nr:glucose-1-phosphate cytidylyltransferase [Candidatus Riflebacteria bacterium]
MKVVILAGGLGTRLSEETVVKPKPMVEIGGKPILWHIMKIYSSYGFNDFVICCGYKGYIIKEYFANYFLHTSDVTIDMSLNKITTLQSSSEPWKITLVDTGDSTATGGRVKRVKKYLDDSTFMLTYGDGVSDVNILKLVEFHKSHKKIATITAVQPPGRFGSLLIDSTNVVSSFVEKPSGDGGYINGGFFVLQPEAINYINDDSCVFEAGALENLARDKQLEAFKHQGFWQPMDTLREKFYLEKLWETGQAPWKLW